MFEVILQIEKTLNITQTLTPVQVNGILKQHESHEHYFQIMGYLHAVHLTQKAALIEGGKEDLNIAATTQVIEIIKKFVEPKKDKSQFAGMLRFFNETQARLSELSSTTAAYNDTQNKSAAAPHAMRLAIKFMELTFGLNGDDRQQAVNVLLEIFRVLDRQYTAFATMTHMMRIYVVNPGKGFEEAREATRKALDEKEAKQKEVAALQQQLRSGGGAGSARTAQTAMTVRKDDKNGGLLAPRNITHDCNTMRRYWSELRCEFLSLLRIDIEMYRTEVDSQNKIVVYQRQQNATSSSSSSFTYTRPAQDAIGLAQKEKDLMLLKEVLAEMEKIFFDAIDEQPILTLGTKPAVTTIAVDDDEEEDDDAISAKPTAMTTKPAQHTLMQRMEILNRKKTLESWDRIKRLQERHEKLCKTEREGIIEYFKDDLKIQGNPTLAQKLLAWEPKFAKDNQLGFTANNKQDAEKICFKLWRLITMAKGADEPQTLTLFFPGDELTTRIKSWEGAANGLALTYNITRPGENSASYKNGNRK